MQFRLDELVRITGVRVLRWPVDGPVQPTHELERAGPGSLFVSMEWILRPHALRSLSATGASAVIACSGDRFDWLERYPDLGVLVAKNPPEAYFALAEEARWRSAGLVAGVTGSSGKSTTRAYLGSILSQRYRVHTNPENLNRWSDCAGVLLSMSGGKEEAAVIEMGFGYPGDVDRMASLARPHYGIITKVTADHLDGGKTWENVAREKAKLGDHLSPGGRMVLHHEDPGCALVDRSTLTAPVITFGESPGADLRYGWVKLDELGTTFTLWLPRTGELVCRVRPVGLQQAANAAAAAAVAMEAGLTPEEIRRGLAQVDPLPRRFRVHRYSRGLTVIDDTFSSSFDAVCTGLENAARLAGKRRKVAVVSGIGQLGELRSHYHRLVGRTICAQRFSAILLVQPDERTDAIRAGAAEAGMRDGFIEVPYRKGLPQALAPLTGPDTLIYCKASQFLWLGPEIDQFLSGLPAAGFLPMQ